MAFVLPGGLPRAARAMEEKVTRAFQRSPRDYAWSGGARIHLNPRNTLAQNASMALARWYEPPVTEVLLSLCRRNGCFLDVGANIGWYTFLGAHRVGPRGLVLGFEPDPENFRLLSSSLAENPRPQVRLFNRCLSDHDGEEQLFLSEEAASFHSIARPVGRRSLVVPAARLDSLVEELRLGPIDLVKIDVEGGEPKVLRGARATLRSGHIHHLLLEWRPEAWVGEDALWEEITSNFDVYRLESSPRLVVPIPAPTVARVSAETTAAGLHGKDLYLAPKVVPGGDPIRPGITGSG